MTDVGFLVAVMGLMGHRERDGHSGAWAMAQPGTVLLRPGRSGCGTSPTGSGSWPPARRTTDLVGARVTKVGHPAGRRRARRRRAARPARQRLDAARQPADLPDPPERPAPSSGVLAAGDPGLTLEHAGRLDPRGHARRGPDRGVPRLDLRRLRRPLPEGLPPDPDGPLYLRHRDLAFWSEALAKPGRDLRRLQRGAAPGRRRDARSRISRRRSEATADAAPGAPGRRRPAQQRRRRQQHVRPAARRRSRRSPHAHPGPRLAASPGARRSRRPATSSRT